MPVNPLTGDILGKPGQKAPEAPRKEYNPGMDYKGTLTNNAMIILFRKYSPWWMVISYLVINILFTVL